VNLEGLGFALGAELDLVGTGENDNNFGGAAGDHVALGFEPAFDVIEPEALLTTPIST